MTIDLQMLGRAVKQAQWRHHRGMDRRLAAIGTTLPQWDALRAIDRAPGSSAHELALETFQSDQAFGTLASRLTAQDLVARSPGAGRRVEHRLTPEGARVLAEGTAMAEDYLAESFADLSEAERESLLGLLSRIGA